MPYIDYVKMTPEQQAQVKQHLLTKSLTEADLPKWKFLVTVEGKVMRRKGVHQPTDETRKEWDLISERIKREALIGYVPGDPAKGSIRHFLSGARYSFSRD